ncbi:tetratricopeptide repeat protein [Pedobacter sp. PLR]|uniref:tetratricopeptide repeat protein n=1 Tax=Pedobacter sp. PLR TaxID=2994465 RepID=UPI0022472356|nr:tetratricopeptide repeat protein [Pedobacter sp. PLR]MCX2451299.1 tetratricopeptide repeat protein [Pedobacter sp. PLR]
MKKLLLPFLILISTYAVNAQTATVVDKEKLLDLFQTQRYLEAAQYLQSIYKEDTTDPKEISQLAYAYLMAGKLPDAEKNYLKLHEAKPDDLAGLFNLSNINLRRGNNAKAREYLSKVVALDSNNFNAYKQIGRIEKEQTDIAQMFRNFKRANLLNPADADVAYEMSELYFKMNNFRLALNVLEPALAADSSNLQLLKMKMPASIASKDYKGSIKTGEKLMSYGDSSTFVLTNMAKSYFLLLNYQKALDYFLKANIDKDDDEGLLYNISLSYRGIKDYKNAAAYLERTIKAAISKKTSSYYGLLGDSYENIDKNDLANAAYKRGLLFENNGSLYYNIALVYETRLNDKKNAISYYQQYLKTVNPAEQAKLVVFIKNKIEELKR